MALLFLFFKQKTAYEMRISDWSSDVCSSDLILLARQLAQLRAAAQLPEDERIALAQLTRDIHAPLANRLGIWQLKWELEDLAFRHLDPDTYRRIAPLLDDKRTGRERYIDRKSVVEGKSGAVR